jgi:hypothetical protein
VSHTPGPWLVSHDEAVFVRGDFDGYDTKTICHTSFEKDEQTPANMRLIAAAPDLLAFAKRALEIHGIDAVHDDELTATVKALIE